MLLEWGPELSSNYEAPELRPSCGTPGIPLLLLLITDENLYMFFQLDEHLFLDLHEESQSCCCCDCSWLLEVLNEGKGVSILSIAVLLLFWFPLLLFIWLVFHCTQAKQLPAEHMHSCSH